MIEAAARLSAARVDVILAYGTTAVQAADRVTAGAPIVSLSMGDPVALNLRAAKTAGITMPPSILLRADRVIR